MQRQHGMKMKTLSKFLRHLSENMHMNQARCSNILNRIKNMVPKVENFTRRGLISENTQCDCTYI